MKKLILASIFVLLSASSFAKDLILTGCTADHRLAQSYVNIDDEAPAKIEAEIRVIYAKVAGHLTFEDFIGSKGFVEFRDSLTAEDKEALNVVQRPEDGGDCTGSK